MDPRISDGEFRTAFRLAQHANAETGAIFPSQERLADQMGKKERTVRACIAGLASKGWLAIWRPNKRAPNSYRFDAQHVNAILDRQLMLNEARAEARKAIEPVSDDRQKSAAQTNLTGRNQPLVTGRNLPLNTLREHLKEGSLYEGEDSIRIEDAREEHASTADPHTPYPVPETEDDLAMMLEDLFTGCRLSPDLLNRMRRLLMAGRLTPAIVAEHQEAA